jgi:transposase InsO family protein
MRQGFLYLVVILDWSTRRVLAWRLSNTLTVRFCVAALREALARLVTPEIFNTEQDSQLTSKDFTTVLRGRGVQISMDGRERCHDNIFAERRGYGRGRVAPSHKKIARPLQRANAQSVIGGAASIGGVVATSL